MLSTLPSLHSGYVVNTRVLRVLGLELGVLRQHLTLDRRLHLHAPRGRHLVVLIIILLDLKMGLDSGASFYYPLPPRFIRT